MTNCENILGEPKLTIFNIILKIVNFWNFTIFLGEPKLEYSTSGKKKGGDVILWGKLNNNCT